MLCFITQLYEKCFFNTNDVLSTLENASLPLPGKGIEGIAFEI